jgi:hypothetical protein
MLKQLKNKLKIGSLLSLLVLAGCSSSKTIPYDAKWNAPFSYVDEVKPDQKDLQSNLEYGIINDAAFLYITMKTKSPRTKQAILTGGVNLSFSPEGQKKGAYSIIFPVVTRDDRKAMARSDIDIPNSMTLSRMIEAYNKEALWKDKSGQHFIDLVSGNIGIRATISLDEDGQLTEQIIIPLSAIGVKLDQVSTLGVAIKIENVSSQGSSGITPRISVGMGGMGGYGMGGYGMGGVGVGFGGGNGRSSDRSTDIRLQVQLAKNE